ncbi:MAG: sensor histidine kinase [Bacteroidales bacterium]|nr:sensor histidine kinase [Bacteroidales bacterium]
MPIIIVALILAVLFQFAAAIIAISLIRHTRYNISWVLISVAFLLMAVRRLMELVEVLQVEMSALKNLASSWMAVGISILILIGLIYIKRIFNLQMRIDELKIENEARVLSAILETEESERQKFAKELHDGLGPLLSSIKMSLSALVPGETAPGQLKILDNTSKLIDESVNTIKEISNKLSPHVLNHFGLLRAISSFINRIGFTHQLSLKVNSNAEGLRFDPNIEVVLYRVVCELINNTITHARASEVNIDLYYNDGRLTLDYYDNGRGFDPEEVLQLQPGMGYSNIQSRIKSIHGTLKVISQPDQGVCISVVLKTAAHG